MQINGSSLKLSKRELDPTQIYEAIVFFDPWCSMQTYHAPISHRRPLPTGRKLPFIAPTDRGMTRLSCPELGDWLLTEMVYGTRPRPMIQVLTRQCTAESRTHNLLITSPTPMLEAIDVHNLYTKWCRGNKAEQSQNWRKWRLTCLETVEVHSLQPRRRLCRVVQKSGTLIEFCDNFRKCAPILTIFFTDWTRNLWCIKVRLLRLPPHLYSVLPCLVKLTLLTPCLKKTVPVLFFE